MSVWDQVPGGGERRALLRMLRSAALRPRQRQHLGVSALSGEVRQPAATPGEYSVVKSLGE